MSPSGSAILRTPRWSRSRWAGCAAWSARAPNTCNAAEFRACRLTSARTLASGIPASRCAAIGTSDRAAEGDNSDPCHDFLQRYRQRLGACLSGQGLGLFLSYQTAPYRNQKKLCYVLEQFETDPLPVHIVYQQAKLVTNKVRAFVDECVAKLRKVPLD